METQATLPTTAPRTLRRPSFIGAVLSMLPVLLAGALWLGLAGMALGTGLALSAVGWTEDTWIGPVVGFALGAHCGLWAGLLFALAPKKRRTLLATLAAGLSEPMVWFFWQSYDAPFSWEEWVTSTLMYGMPFLCGWGFARAMSGRTRLPLFAGARAALATDRPAALRTRLAASVVTLAVGYAAIAVATMVLNFLGTLLPLAPSPFTGID